MTFTTDYNRETARNRLSLPDITALKAREARERDSREMKLGISALGGHPNSAWKKWYSGAFIEGLNSQPIEKVNKLSYYPELSQPERAV